MKSNLISSRFTKGYEGFDNRIRMHPLVRLLPQIWKLSGYPSGNIDQSDTLSSTAGNCGSGAEEVKSTLIEVYREYQAVGKVEYEGEEDKINRYSQSEMAQRFAQVLDSVSR